MKYLLMLCISVVFLIACNNKTNTAKNEYSYKNLYADKINTVTLMDTMVIHDSVCRSCIYVNTTEFEIKDTANVVGLYSIKTYDYNIHVAGGFFSKDIIIIPLKKGTTVFKFFKINNNQKLPKDSLNFIAYELEVKE